MFVDFESPTQAPVVARGSSSVSASQWGYTTDVWGGKVNIGLAGACYLGANVRGYTAAPGTITLSAKGFAAATGVALTNSPPWSWAAIWNAKSVVEGDGMGGLAVNSSAAAAVIGSVWTSVEEVDCGASAATDSAVVHQRFETKSGLWGINETLTKTTGTGAKWCTFVGGSILGAFAGLRMGYTTVVAQEPVFLPRYNTYIKKRTVKKIFYIRNFPYMDTSHCLRTTFYVAGAAGAATTTGAGGSVVVTQTDGLQQTYEANFKVRADGSSTDADHQWSVGAWINASPQDPNIPADARTFFDTKYGAAFAVRKLHLASATPGRCGLTEVCLYDPEEGASPADDAATSQSVSAATRTLAGGAALIVSLLIAVLLQ